MADPSSDWFYAGTAVVLEHTVDGGQATLRFDQGDAALVYPLSCAGALAVTEGEQLQVAFRWSAAAWAPDFCVDLRRAPMAPGEDGELVAAFWFSTACEPQVRAELLWVWSGSADVCEGVFEPCGYRFPVLYDLPSLRLPPGSKTMWETYLVRNGSETYGYYFGGSSCPDVPAFRTAGFVIAL